MTNLSSLVRSAAAATAATKKNLLYLYLSFSFMGSCVSSYAEPSQTATVMVILPNGSLQEFRLPVLAQHLLDANPAHFVCNSDSMCYDETIPPMAPEDELHPGQLYFVLPAARLKQPLAASDMAALAVKASVAMGRRSKKRKGDRTGFGRVVPVWDRPVRVGSGEFKPGESGGLGKVGIRRSGSVRRLPRAASMKARFACSSFRLRLSTIHEELDVD